MLSKINTKKKLLLFPAMFVIIVIFVGVIYTHYSNIADQRNELHLKLKFLFKMF